MSEPTGAEGLGGRSILGDARSQEMQSRMNQKIKFRESFRPFAPAILRDRVEEFFQMEGASPYMLLVAPVQESQRKPPNGNEAAKVGLEKLKIPRSTLPAVTHVDYSARVQTVDGEYHPKFYKLLKAFETQTQCPVLINTSFNVRGEPIISL